MYSASGSTKVLRKKPLGSLHTNGNPPASVRRLATYASQSNLTNGKAKVDNVDKGIILISNFLFWVMILTYTVQMILKLR